MGEMGRSVLMNTTDTYQKRTDFINWTIGQVRKIVLKRIKEYYLNNNKSFTGINCEAIAKESQKDLKDITKGANIGRLEMDKDHLDRLINVRTTTVMHFMKVLDEDAYNEFVAQKNNDIER